MNIEVKKSIIDGQVDICPSKSDEQRIIAISTLSKHEIEISNEGNSADVKSCRTIANQIKHSNNTIFNCGESALCARMFPPIIALKNDDFTIDGIGSLHRRNIHKDYQVFEKLFSWNINSNILPIHISNAKITPGTYNINGSSTSQIISGLILALSTLKEDSTLIVDNPVSTPYIILTIQTANKAGAKIKYGKQGNSLIINIPGNTNYAIEHYDVEGDWSNAAFFIAAGISNNDISIRGLNKDSYQPDKSILEVLQLCNVKFSFDGNFLRIPKTNIPGFNFDATNCPDLIPPLCAMAITATCKSTIKGANRLTNKESNRLEAITKELLKIGVHSFFDNDILTIYPSKETQQAIVDSHNDHRIAMMLTIVGLNSQSLIVRNCECVEKSYPNFFDDIIKIRANVNKID